MAQICLDAIERHHNMHIVSHSCIASCFFSSKFVLPGSHLPQSSRPIRHFWLELGMDPESGPHAIGRGIGDEEAPDASPRDLWELLWSLLFSYLFVKLTIS